MTLPPRDTEATDWPFSTPSLGTGWALTAQLVSNASRELLGHLTPGSRCKERQIGVQRGRKRKQTTCEVSFYGNKRTKPGVQKEAALGSAQRTGAGGSREPGGPAQPDLTFPDFFPRAQRLQPFALAFQVPVGSGKLPFLPCSSEFS